MEMEAPFDGLLTRQSWKESEFIFKKDVFAAVAVVVAKFVLSLF